MAKKKTKKEFKVTDKISLPINEKGNEFVPESEDFKGNERLVEQVAVGVDLNMPVLMIGETGSGKTSLVRYLANKTNNGFRRVNHNGATTVDDIVGRILIKAEEGTYWVDGVLVDAMKNGYWYLADEINAASPEINFAYHQLLDDDRHLVLAEHDGEVVKPHPNFRFFAAMNPPEHYVGTKQLNKALMSRFIVMKTEFPSPNDETNILVERGDIASDDARRMVDFAVSIRANHAKGKSDFVLSTRDLIMWAKLFKVYGKYITSAEMTILNKVSPDDFEMVKDMLSMELKPYDDAEDPSKVDEKKSKLDSLKKGTKVKLKDYKQNEEIKAHDGQEFTVGDEEIIDTKDLSKEETEHYKIKDKKALEVVCENGCVMLTNLSNVKLK